MKTRGKKYVGERYINFTANMPSQSQYFGYAEHSKKYLTDNEINWLTKFAGSTSQLTSKIICRETDWILKKGTLPSRAGCIKLLTTF